uniref:Nudix hydrolase domain-containing protein n=1 Tax=viral metagenome TaxID=1070528 RepID=A0A6C0J7H3_9ZZZZ
MEICIPIKIKNIKVNKHIGLIERENIQYYNIHVPDCPKYTQTHNNKYNYIRTNEIKRYTKENNILWPDHPENIQGNNLGAIIIIKSKDNRYLLVRNGDLWGLPKGARHYRTFTRLQKECMISYKCTGDIPIASNIIFDENDEETAEENVIREIFEETGIILVSENLKVFTKNNKYAYTRFIYDVEFNAEEYINILKCTDIDHENDEILWLLEEEILLLMQKHKSKKIYNNISYYYMVSYFGDCF